MWQLIDNSGNQGGVGIMLKSIMRITNSELYHNMGYDCAVI